eukprot:12896230-Prorocentrum_lima.AAC.1
MVEQPSGDHGIHGHPERKRNVRNPIYRHTLGIMPLMVESELARACFSGRVYRDNVASTGAGSA